MPAPEWGSFVSTVDGSLNPVLVSDLDQEVLKELMAKNRGLTLHDLKKRSSEYPWVTTTSNESYDEVETAAISPPMADADDHLSEIAIAIPPVDSEVLNLKHSAFLAQLLLEEVDLESTSAMSYDHIVLSMRLFDSPIGKVLGAKPSPNNMPVSICSIYIYIFYLSIRRPRITQGVSQHGEHPGMYG